MAGASALFRDCNWDLRARETDFDLLVAIAPDDCAKSISVALSFEVERTVLPVSHTWGVPVVNVFSGRSVRTLEVELGVTVDVGQVGGGLVGSGVGRSVVGRGPGSRGVWAPGARQFFSRRAAVVLKAFNAAFKPGS